MVRYGQASTKCLANAADRVRSQTIPGRPVMPQNRIVICMKWGNLYTADYVNVLFNACRTQTACAFRFICLTDESKGLAPEIEVFPIPEIGCTSAMWRHGAWPKLGVFSADLFGLQGRALFIDLDTVICGGLDRFFEHPSPFVVIDTGTNWRPGRQPGGPEALAGTGVFAFDLGSQTQILTRFQSAPQIAFDECGIEQVWVQKHASSIDYWPADWVVSFKRWLRQPIGLDIFLPPKPPPKTAGMVAFHGEPRPISLIRPGRKRWDRLPHLGRGQVLWMTEYWCRNGGKLE